MLSQASKLTPAQNHELIRALGPAEKASPVVQTLESRGLSCPHCNCERVVRNGHASGLQRDRCRKCSKTFNALTATPLTRLRHKDKWPRQAEVLPRGLSVHQATGVLTVAPITAFRWRRRFLQAGQGVKARVLQSVVEADETDVLLFSKGQRVQPCKARHRGAAARPRGACPKNSSRCWWSVIARA